MSPPIYTPDGSEVSEIVLPDGSTASEVIGPDGNVVFEAGPDIPDSVVTRTGDDSSVSQTAQRGVRIESDDAWPEIGANISANTANVTKAYVYRVSDGTLLGDTDVTGLSSGDSFTVSLNPSIQPSDGTDATKYSFVLDAEGASYTQGYNNLFGSYPIPSPDGNLRILSGATGPSSTEKASSCINDIGNTGF